MKTLFFILGVIILSTFLAATIINVPVDQPTIQEGINVAVVSDTVLVQPGTYLENINFNGKNITVASLFLTTQDTIYISQTIIDGDSIDCVVTFESGEDWTSVLTGFIITNGTAEHGAGILCYNSSPNLENITITGNSALFGGGIYCGQSNATIKNNQILNNSADYGGGIYCDNSSPSLENVTIINNSAISGGGVYCWSNSNPTLMNVTITGNYADWAGGGIYCHINSSPNLVNCILWNDTPQEIAGPTTVFYSDIQGEWPGTGNIDEDPLFVSPDDGDYHLQDTSPCIGAGIDEIEIDGTWYYAPEFDIEGNPRPDPAGSMPDMGAYENPYGEPQVGIDDNLFSIYKYRLNNYPNPFNPTTIIGYSIPQETDVVLKIYNIKGQLLKVLVNDFKNAGEHSAIWDGRDSNDNQISSGIYFYKLNVNGKTEVVKKCLLLK
jgi:predicted outer membrane repeat protein